MKKLLVAIAALLVSHASWSCDVCGCAINAGGADVVPGVFQNYIGFRSNIRSFKSEHFPLFDNELPIQSKEWFHTSEVHFRYSPVRRLQFFGFVPLNAVLKTEEQVNHQVGGLGDVRFRMNWVAIDENDLENKKFSNVFLGSSIKLPTGRNEFQHGESAVFHRNMLPGTGTIDLAFHLDVMLRKKQFGTLWSNTVMLRGTNDFQYQFGNLFASQWTGFYKNEKPNATYLIEAGFNFIHMEPDVDLRWNEVQVFSQGTMLAPMLRATFLKKNWMLQAMANRAAWQDMALGQVKHNYHLELGITYLFN